MSYFTSSPNTDLIIFNLLDDKSWINFCFTSKKHYHLGLSERYCKARLLTQYDKKIIMLKPDDITYKQQYIDIVELLYTKGGRQWTQRPDLMLLIFTRYNVKDDNYLRRRLMYHLSPIAFEFYCEHVGQQPDQILDEWDIHRCLIESENVTLQNYCREHYPNSKHLSKDTINSLCGRGTLAVLKSLSQNGHNPDSRGLDEAIKYGQEAIVKWLIDVLKFEITDCNLFVAALHNQPEIYEMLVNQYKVEPKNLLPELSDLKPEMIMLFVQKFKFKPCQDNIDYAVYCNHVPAVKLLMEEYNLQPSQDSIDIALSHDTFDVLVYLWSTHKLKPTDFDVKTENLTHLKWYLKEYDLEPTQDLVSTNPHLEILEYLLHRICFVTKRGRCEL